MTQVLVQFQCQKEGSLFYYQHIDVRMARYLARHCPVCGSKRIRATGRIYPAVDERQSGELMKEAIGG
jgi:hypothetical protein